MQISLYDSKIKGYRGTLTGNLEKKINKFLNTIQVENFVDMKLSTLERSKFAPGGAGTYMLAIILYKI